MQPRRLIQRLIAILLGLAIGGFFTGVLSLLLW